MKKIIFAVVLLLSFQAQAEWESHVAVSCTEIEFFQEMLEMHSEVVVKTWRSHMYENDPLLKMAVNPVEGTYTIFLDDEQGNGCLLDFGYAE